ncbi:MAG: class F sortase [Chloroflexi bacterium]|nr:class F sortase [Chloroflexota bacterium]
MSGQTSHPKNEVRVPLSVVLISLGLVIVAAVTAVWLLIPASIPRPVYAAINNLLPPELMIPTPAAVAVLPTAVPPSDTATSLLPETTQEMSGSNNGSVMTLAEALEQGPRPGKPVRIVIPDIDLDAPVEEIGVTAVQSGGQTYYQWLVPDAFIAGWHDNSALLGQPGNTVLNGHHNVYGEVFRDVIDLDKGTRSSSTTPIKPTPIRLRTYKSC